MPQGLAGRSRKNGIGCHKVLMEPTHLQSTIKMGDDRVDIEQQYGTTIYLLDYTELLQQNYHTKCMPHVRP